MDLMLLTSLMEAIDNHGYLTLLSSSGIMYLIYLIKKLYNKYILKLSLSIKKDVPKLEIQLLNKNINNILINIVNLTNCDRILIFKLHNLNTNINTNYKYLTCLFEYINNKEISSVLKPVKDDLIDLPISTYNYIFNKIKNKKVYLLEDISKLNKVDPNLFIRLQNKGAKSIICVPMWSSGCEVDYFAFIQFNKTKKRDYSTLVKKIPFETIKIKTLMDSIKSLEGLNLEEEILNGTIN